MQKKCAFISGATAGIGEATAMQLAQQGYSLVLTGRRNERLQKLKEKLSEITKVETITFDVSSREACEKVFAENKEKIRQVDTLINNAGLARGVEKVQEARIDDWEGMIDTNVKGLLYLTRLLLPILEKNQPSHIINIGSVAGRGVYPGGTVYAATKFAVRALTEGMRMDLMGRNIRVTNISPGMVETEFSKVRLKDDDKAAAVYQGMKPLTAADIAECISWSLLRPAHVNIQEMLVYPTEQASMHHVHREA